MDKALKITIVLSAIWLISWGVIDQLNRLDGGSIDFVYPFEIEKGRDIQYHRANLLWKGTSDLQLKDVHGKPVKDWSMSIDKLEADTSSADRNGFDIPVHKLSGKGLAPGLYYINDHVNFIVQSDQNTTVTVVYPFIADQALNSRGGSSFTRQDAEGSVFDYLSLKRPLNPNPKTKAFLQILEDSLKEVSYSVISDQSLDNKGNWKKSKLLVFPGDFMFMTGKARKNIQQYLEDGGRVLLFATYFQTNYCRTETDKIFGDTLPRRESGLQSWSNLGIGPEVDYGITYGLGGYPKAHFWELKEPSHPIFNGVTIIDNRIPFNATLLMGAVSQPDPSLQIRILAETPATYRGVDQKGVMAIIQRNKWKGQIICMGSSDWLIKPNIHLSNSRNLIVNSVKYALNGNLIE